MSTMQRYPARLDFDADHDIQRWQPIVQWILAIPHLVVANVLGTLREVLTLISLFTVLFTRRIPRAIFDAIAMTYRYEWRAMSYAMFMHDDYPPFDFTVGATDDEVEPHTTLTIDYPQTLDRWKPLYKWFIAIPHYFVLIGLSIASVPMFLVGFFAVLFTGRYPAGIRNFLINVYRYGLRVQAYVGLLTDTYPPFALSA